LICRPFDEKPLLRTQPRLARVAANKAHLTAAKRPLRVSLVSSLQLMIWNACAGNDCAKALTFRGCSVGARRGITGGRPLPL
jgi:hypothetical protein